MKEVPQSELKRSQVQGWVKQEGVKSQEELEEERRQAFKATVAARKEEDHAATLKTTRQLPSIPKQVMAETTSTSSEASSFCPHCGKDLDWKFCPYCGKPLPHD